jgi:hypothetical protein
VINQQHQILHLGQVLEAANEAYPPLWDVLSQNSVSVGMMGSLHSSTLPSNAAQYAFYVPDFSQTRPSRILNRSRPFRLSIWR